MSAKPPASGMCYIASDVRSEHSSVLKHRMSVLKRWISVLKHRISVLKYRISVGSSDPRAEVAKEQTNDDHFNLFLKKRCSLQEHKISVGTC